MYLVLLRHAQAKDASDGMDDAERELTKAGRRALRATLPGTLGLLPSNGRIAVWSSPLVRARQTADIVIDAVADTLGSGRLANREPVVLDSLAEPGLDGVLSELAGHVARRAGNARPELPPDDATSREPAPEEAMSEESADAEPSSADSVSALDSCAQAPDDADAEDIVVLVGHEPQISRLAEHLSGASLDFKKGAALCVRLDSDTERDIARAVSPEAALPVFSGAAQVRWFVQGPAYRRWKTLVSLEKTLEDAFGRVTDELERFLANPVDADAVHDLRVSVRTLRSLLSFVEPFQKHRQNRDLQKGLRSIVAQLSRLREYDVLLDQAGRVDISFTSMAEGVVPPKKLDGELAERRDAERDRVVHEFSRHHFQKRLHEIEHGFRHVRWRRGVEREGLEESDLARRFGQMASAFLDAYAVLDLADVEETHAVRKQAKQVRYVASCLEPLLGPQPELVAELKAVQDALGALCDVRVNAELLEDMAHSREGLSDIARWQADNFVAQERDTEARLVHELTEEVRQGEEGELE